MPIFFISESFSKLFEWRGWLVPSRLSYSMYLLHMNLVHAALGLRTQLATISPFYLLVTYFGILMMSFLIALPFYLVVEGPLAGLLLSLLGNRQKTHPQHNNEKKLT
ncbi:uncharacterized protein LOC123721817 [Papilio machaon]|uniref:uncharacterized protein LOC123721817 n=1 Tax=Papilio machaon TaxID=76193 RepID=UPI001E66458B|nr:uncharacterized protein LOC123721817 [Papilio machaon]